MDIVYLGRTKLAERTGRPGEFRVEAALGTFTLSSPFLLLCTSYGLGCANQVRGTLQAGDADVYRPLVDPLFLPSLLSSPSYPLPSLGFTLIYPLHLHSSTG